MASPTTTKSTMQNVLVAVSLAASKNLGVYRDVSAVFEDQLTVRMTTGTAAGTSGLRVDAYYAYAATTLNGAISASATSMTLTAITGAANGQKIFIAPDGTNQGEMVTTSAAPSGSTVSIAACEFAHANLANVYFVEQLPSVTVTLQNPATGAAASNTTYARTLYLPTGTYVVLVTNLDASNAVTVDMSAGQITGIV